MTTQQLKKQAKLQGVRIIEMRCKKTTEENKVYVVTVMTLESNIDPQTGERIDSYFGPQKPVFTKKQMTVATDGTWTITD